MGDHLKINHFEYVLFVLSKLILDAKCVSVIFFKRIILCFFYSSIDACWFCKFIFIDGVE